MKALRVLVACEMSGRVKTAFRKRGFDAWSCDIQDSEIPNDPYHIKDDVLKHLNDGWDLMIAHPPCTYLTYAGTRHWHKPGREEQRREAMAFFMACVNAPIANIAIENPLGLPCQEYRTPDQTIHPYFFGERQMKRTCLWLKNLPRLYWQPWDDMFGARTATDKPQPISIDATPNHHKRYFTDAKISDAKTRSATFECVANAMAQQWGDYVKAIVEAEHGGGN